MPTREFPQFVPRFRVVDFQNQFKITSIRKTKTSPPQPSKPKASRTKTNKVTPKPQRCACGYFPCSSRSKICLRCRRPLNFGEVNV